MSSQEGKLKVVRVFVVDVENEREEGTGIRCSTSFFSINYCFDGGL